jgi:hypothetical protein
MHIPPPPNSGTYLHQQYTHEYEHPHNRTPGKAGRQARREEEEGHLVCTRDAVSALFPTMSSISLPSSRTVPKGKDSGREVK